MNIDIKERLLDAWNQPNSLQACIEIFEDETNNLINKNKLLEDALLNMKGGFDNPITRRNLTPFQIECIKSMNDALEYNIKTNETI